MKKTNRPLVLISVMFAMFMAAIEVTIIATAMPSIVADLGGFSLFSWVFSAFMLAQAVTIPIYGKLADLYGRKPVFIVGVTLFLIGSLLCGYASNMKFLILFRLIQGIGAGAVTPIAVTVIGDIYSVEERAKIQGYLASVWGVSSIIGPAVGAFFVQYIHWAWAFWVNIPIGVFAVLGMWFFLQEDVEKRSHQIDYLGSVLIFVSVSSLMILLIQAGVTWAWISLPSFLIMVLFIIGIVLFILQERRAAEPVVPLGIWKDPLISISNLATFTTGIIIMGISTFLPTFVQGVLGKTPMIAGFALAFMSIGWPLASTFAGKIMIKYGFRKIAILGGAWIVTGSLFFTTLKPERGWLWAGFGSFIIGVGMGLARTVFIVSIQNSVDWKQRGVATAANMFMNILGSAVGASLLGGILNNRLAGFLQKLEGGEKLNIDAVNTLLDSAKRASLSSQQLINLKEALTSSLASVYFGVFIFALISLSLVIFFPIRSIKPEK